MSNEIKRCFPCGAPVPEQDGPTHRYMASSPGCWAVYGEVLAREYEDVRYAANHRLTVDAYAVQHPGEPGRQALRSVCLHLCSLHLVLERAVPPQRATEMLASLAERDDYTWLEPPPSTGAVTVADVHAAVDPFDHLARVEDWARSAWAAWRRHHATIRAWVAAAG